MRERRSSCWAGAAQFMSSTLCYQVCWGDDLGSHALGEKVQASGGILYFCVIKQTGGKGFYKLSVSEE